MKIVPRISTDSLATRLDVRWQDAAWSAAVVVVPAVRAATGCHSLRRPGKRPFLRNPFLKRFDP